MSYQNVLNYVDQVVKQADVPAEYKTGLENELIRNILAASDDSPKGDIMEVLVSPEKLAGEITKKLNREIVRSEIEADRCRPPEYCPPRHHRYAGEYMRERSNVNLKVLYIPLLQISSGTDRLTMPLMEDY